MVEHNDQHQPDLVTVELRRVVAGDITQRTTVATLHVHPDRTWTVTGDPNQVPTGIRVYDASSQHWVSLQDDPVTWARQLHTELRSGYLSAHITTDNIA
jgi:hypothetical protein